MGKSPAFQFYANDWLSSTRIMLMTPAEEGAYIRLLAIAWNSEDCSLPDDDEQLARLSRLGEAWFKGSSTVVRACFFSKGGRLYNARLLSERKKQEEWRRKCRRGGIASGKARKNKSLQNEEYLKGSSRVVELKGNTSSSSSSSSSISNNKYIYSQNSTEFRLAELLLTKILDRNPNFKKPDLQKWAVHIDRMIRLDKREPPEIAKVIEWCQQDDFWQDNILSTQKLRKQYDQLVMKMNKPKRYKKGFDSNRLLQTIAEVQLD